MLLYPDIKVCNLLPRSNESFTVEKINIFYISLIQRLTCLFVCLETHFLSLVEGESNAFENNDNENKYKSQLNESYLKRVEETLTLLIILLLQKRTISLSHTLLKIIHEALLLKMTAIHYTIPPSRQSIFKTFCPSCIKSIPALVIEANADASADKHKSMNILCHSSVIEIDSDGQWENTVFANSQSGEKVTSVSVSENPDQCRKILKKAVTNCGADINKNLISITVFRMSCFNDFYSFFCKPWIEKKDCCCRYEIKFAVEDAINEGDVSREFYTGRAGS